MKAKFCDNPKCLMHADVDANTKSANLDFGGTKVNIKRYALTEEGKETLFFCEMCRSAIDMVKDF